MTAALEIPFNQPVGELLARKQSEAQCQNDIYFPLFRVMQSSHVVPRMYSRYSITTFQQVCRLGLLKRSILKEDRSWPS